MLLLATAGIPSATSFIALPTVLSRTARSFFESLSNPNAFITAPTVVALINRVKRTNAHTNAIIKFFTSWLIEGFSTTAKAKAKDTAPRKPPHHMTVLKPKLTGGQMPVELKIGRIPCVNNARAPNPTTSRVTSVSHISGPKSDKYVGTAIPTNININEFAQKPKVSHVSSRSSHP